MRKAIFALAALSLFVIGPAVLGTAQSLSQGGGDLRVMAYNVDEGTDFVEVASATTTLQLLLASNPGETGKSRRTRR